MTTYIPEAYGVFLGREDKKLFKFNVYIVHLLKKYLFLSSSSSPSLISFTHVNFRSHPTKYIGIVRHLCQWKKK